MIRKNFTGIVVNMLNNRLPALCLFLLALSISAGGSTAAFAQFVTEKSPEESSALEQAPPPPVAAPAVYTGGSMTVTDVIIDKTGKNAVVARDGAIIDAQHTAFQVLAEKAMSPEAFKAYKLPDNKTIAALVDSFEIKTEQISANRYVANFTVRFLPDINNYIRIPESLGKVVVAGPAASPSAVPSSTSATTATASAGASATPETATTGTRITPRSRNHA